MMKRTIIILSFILMALLPARAIKRIDANPINIAFGLSQETDSANIATTLAYYGYEQLDTPPSGGWGASYRHSNGSIIRVTPPSEGWSNLPLQGAGGPTPSGGWGIPYSYPTIEVKSNRGSNDADNALKGLDFKKSGGGYIRNVGHQAKTETRCIHTSGGYLSFQRSKISRE